MSYSPLFSFLSSKNYTGAFILGSIAASFSSSLAVYYSLIHKTKIELCRQNSDKLNTIYCKLNQQNLELTTFNIFMKTMIITFLLSYILFIFFGYGGGAINEYYTPSFLTLKRGFLIICLLLFIYFVFHYLSSYYITKKIPNIKHVFKGTIVDLGLMQNNTNLQKNKKKNNKYEYLFLSFLLIIIFSILIFLSIKHSNRL